MAEAPEDVAVRRLGFAVVGSILVLLWLAIEIDNARLAGRIDPRERCAAAETRDCFTDESGRVDSVDGDQVTVRYNDGRDTIDVTLAADSEPAPGELVRLERWNHSIVSLYVTGRERRYRTIYWPRRWDPYLIWVGVLGAACLISPGVAGVRWVVQAATSNGKPWRSRRRSKSRR